MRISKALSILIDLRFTIQQAAIPTLLELIRSPTLLLRPYALSKLWFSNVWNLFGDGTDAANRPGKEALIQPNAYGVVLDLGAGHGHTASYISQNRITKYVAVEPNTLMHSHIRAAAARTGLSEEAGTLLILSCGAEDVSAIISALGGEHKVDTLVSVLTLCTVPQVEQTIRRLVDDVLKPGGQLLFYEHVASRRPDVLFWQRVWSPIWKIFFDGCVLDRPTDLYITNQRNKWETFPSEDSSGNRTGIWGKAGEEDDNLFSHRVGRLIKRNLVI